jgi:hypothetical protein
MEDTIPDRNGNRGDVLAIDQQDANALLPIAMPGL